MTWVDFDLDGDLDLHVVNRGTVDTGNAPDVLLRNDGGVFTSLEGSSWVPGFSTFMADGAEWGDLDGDGDPDVMVQEGSGPIAFTVGCPALLYRNDGPTGHWLKVALAPPPGAGTAIGAKVDAWTGGQRVHRRLSANSWRGFQPPLELSFGLGSAPRSTVVVAWPNGTATCSAPASLRTSASFLCRERAPPRWCRCPSGRTLRRSLVPQPARGQQTLRLLAPSGAPVRVGSSTRGGPACDLGVPHSGRRTVDVRWDGRDAEGRPVAPASTSCAVAAASSSS